MHVAREETTTVTAAANELGLTVPTAHHLLATLAAEGLVARDMHRGYVLGPAVGVLADRYQRAITVPPWLMIPLRELSAVTGETVYLSAWRNEEIQVLASIEGAAAVHVTGTDVGIYHSAYARATGKLLLAHATSERRQQILGEDPLVALTPGTTTDRDVLNAEFEQIRERGWSCDIEEFTKGVCCISVPLIADDTVLAAFTVSVPAHNFSRRRAGLLSATRAAVAAATEEQPDRSEEE